MKTYSEKLKDPKWQRKRLEIMQRDDFTCQGYHEQCEGKQLQIHHIYYKKGKEPWEYDNDELITLCEDCHKSITYQTFAYLKLSNNPQCMLINSSLLEMYQSFKPYTRSYIYDLSCAFISLREESDFEPLRDVYQRIGEILKHENDDLEDFE